MEVFPVNIHHYQVFLFINIFIIPFYGLLFNTIPEHFCLKDGLAAEWISINNYRKPIKQLASCKIFSLRPGLTVSNPPKNGG